MKLLKQLLLCNALLCAACTSPTPTSIQNHASAPEEPFTEADSIVRGIARTSFPERNIIVRNVEQSNADSSISLPLLQQAIDSCSASGGGHVTVQAGTYRLNGSLHLKSNVDLHLEEGATLLFSGRPDDFLPTVLTRWEGTELFGHSPMIYAYHAENIAISGRGVINAQGGLEFAAWGPLEMPDVNRLRAMGETLTPIHSRIFGQGTLLRPSCIQFFGCSRILVQEITVKDSPFWTIHPVYCDNIIVRDVTIDSHFPNNDGCDPESSSNVLIENCTFRTGDDAIAIKAGRDADGRNVGRPSENIVIRHCIFNSECNGLCIGSEMSGGVANVYMHDIQIGTVKNAIYFKSNRDRGGYIRNVRVKNIEIERTFGAILRFETNYFGYRGGLHNTRYENFKISDVHAKVSDRFAIFMDGYEEQPISDIQISRFTVDQAKYAAYFRCTADIDLQQVCIGGETLPEHPDNQEEKIALDTY